MKRFRNCDGKGNAFREIVHTEVLDRCPRAAITPESWKWIRHYSRFKEGLLPNPGGTGNQDRRYMQAMDVIAGEFSKVELEDFENRKKELEKRK